MLLIIQGYLIINIQGYLIINKTHSRGRGISIIPDKLSCDDSRRRKNFSDRRCGLVGI